MTIQQTRILTRPVISEKSSLLSQAGTYAFVVDARATKQDVRDAVKNVFNVQVTSVHVISIPAKRIQRGRQRGWRGGYKKALVTLAEGQTIDVT